MTTAVLGRTGRRATFGALVIAMLALPLIALGSPQAAVGATAPTGSAVTKVGPGRFSDLEVTVSQTKHLRNQVITIGWTGFKQTSELTGNFSSNYLQIMQCWNETRESCQFGGLVNETRGGIGSASRQATYGSLLDPLEPIKQPTGPLTDPLRVPFKAVNGKTTTDLKNEFYDQYSTNEIPFGRSSAAGTGTEYFEVQTAREAPGLGCAAKVPTGARSCYLVVVPRDNLEVTGLPATPAQENRLITSPLSQSNWNNRLSFKLDFDPISVSCPLGKERRLLGNEDIVEAVTRWQPVLCGSTGSIFGYSQLGDSQARNQVANGDDPWMSIVNEPITPERIADGRELTYAPVGVNGIGIAFNIDRQPGFDAPDDVVQKRGTKVLNLKLNARLVAKLLTQSYNLAALSRPEAMADNPLSLSEDQEFQELNPEFKQLAFLKVRQIVNPLGLADANRALWAWIASDQDAVRFINGKPDRYGMVVNPAYQGMTLDRDDFPRADLGCRPGPDASSPSCPLDALAYSADFHDAGRSAARGDNLERQTWDPQPPASWKKNAPQLSGERQTLALVDTATAARYKLPMASLLNDGGEFVTPTTASMKAALGGLKETGVAGVKRTDPGYGNDKAYPLTAVSYAVTAPKKLTDDEATAYSRLIRYVTTKGQQPGIEPGRLPEGYVPLPAEMRTQAAAAAAVIAKGADAPDKKPTQATTDPDVAGNATGVPTGPVAAAGDPGTVTPVGTPVPGAVEPLSSRTPSAPAGGARFLLVAALLLGVVVAVSKPAAPLVRHLFKRGAKAP